MGNRTSLLFGKSCEFEANNCIPITWLALFEPHELFSETRNLDGDEYEITMYRASRADAWRRVETAIANLRCHPHVWRFLRPLEILRDELHHCGMDGDVELDVTQFVSIDQSMAQRVGAGPTTLAKIAADLTGNESHDLGLLTSLTNDFKLTHINSLADLEPEDCMFILIGTYWGEPTRQEKYSPAFFGKSYWQGSP